MRFSSPSTPSRKARGMSRSMGLAKSSGMKTADRFISYPAPAKRISEGVEGEPECDPPVLERSHCIQRLILLEIRRALGRCQHIVVELARAIVPLEGDLPGLATAAGAACNEQRVQRIGSQARTFGSGGTTRRHRSQVIRALRLCKPDVAHPSAPNGTARTGLCGPFLEKVFDQAVAYFRRSAFFHCRRCLILAITSNITGTMIKVRKVAKMSP